MKDSSPRIHTDFTIQVMNLILVFIIFKVYMNIHIPGSMISFSILVCDHCILFYLMFIL